MAAGWAAACGALLRGRTVGGGPGNGPPALPGPVLPASAGGREAGRCRGPRDGVSSPRPRAGATAVGRRAGPGPGPGPGSLGGLTRERLLAERRSGDGGVAGPRVGFWQFAGWCPVAWSCVWYCWDVAGSRGRDGVLRR